MQRCSASIRSSGVAGTQSTPPGGLPAEISTVCTVRWLGCESQLHRKHLNEISLSKRGENLKMWSRKRYRRFWKWNKELKPTHLIWVLTMCVKFCGQRCFKHSPLLAHLHPVTQERRHTSGNVSVFFFLHKFVRALYTKSLVLICLVSCKYFSPAFLHLLTSFSLLKHSLS